MNYALIIDSEDGGRALVKSTHYERCYAVLKLCELHLAKLFPESEVELSTDSRRVRGVCMHPDKDVILSRLLALEFPLPVAHDILEGEYTAM